MNKTFFLSKIKNIPKITITKVNFEFRFENSINI